MPVKCKAKLVGMAILRYERTSHLICIHTIKHTVSLLRVNSSFHLKMHNWPHTLVCTLKHQKQEMNLILSG